MMTVTDAQMAYDLIREQIITTRMPPGQVIQINEMMSMLGFGRTPIREALKRLEVEKLVSVSPRRGMFVTDVSVNDLLQVFEIRMDLEALCVGLAVERINHAELAELRTLVQQLETLGPAGGAIALLEVDRQLHALLARASHNVILQAEADRLLHLSLRIWYLCLDQMRSTDLAEDAFCEILVACETQDRPRAEKAMRRHILQFYESIKEAL